MSKIKIEKMSFSYGNIPAIRNVNLTIEEGERVGVIGANGAGKSTLLKILVGLLSEYEGTICFEEYELKKENYAKIRQKLGYVFQDSESQLFMNTVSEDVAFAPRNYGYSEETVKQRVEQALSQTRIEHLAGRHIYSLSGGQKKLVAIASILSVGLDTILMDEPSVALDPINRENLIHILKELPGTQLIASHDLDLIYDVCDRVILISDGEIVFDGPAELVLKDKNCLEKNGLRLPLSFRFLQKE